MTVCHNNLQHRLPAIVVPGRDLTCMEGLDSGVESELDHSKPGRQIYLPS